MGIWAEEFQKGQDIYVWYDFEDMFVRWEAATDRYFSKFVGENEHEVPGGTRTSKLLSEAIRFGDACTKDEYERGEALIAKE